MTGLSYIEDLKSKLHDVESRMAAARISSSVGSGMVEPSLRGLAGPFLPGAGDALGLDDLGVVGHATIPKRLARLKQDPWDGFREGRQSITARMRRSVGMIG